MKALSYFFVSMLAIIVVACTSTTKITTNFDRNEHVDMSDYKTFSWLKSDKILAHSDDLNPVMKLRIDAAIEQAFIAKGYRLVNAAEKADFTISYTVGKRDHIKIDNFPVGYRTTFGWGHRYYGMNIGTETRISNYTEGKLAIDVYDVKSRQPAWHGWATKRLTAADKADLEVTIQLIASEVLSQF